MFRILIGHNSRWITLLLVFCCISLSATAAPPNKTSANTEKRLQEVVRLQQSGLLDSAIYVLNKELNSLNRRSKSKAIDIDKVHLYYALGNVHLQKGIYSKAVESYEKGLSLAVKRSMTSMEAKILNSLGSVYVETENYRKGGNYVKDALKIYEDHFPERQDEICLLLTNVGNIQLELKEYDAAFGNLKRALQINEKIKNECRYPLIYSGLGQCHLKKKEFNNAIQSFDLGLKSSKNCGNLPAEIANMANLSDVFIELGDYDIADSILVEAYAKITNNKDKYLLKELLSSLIDLHDRQGNFDIAYNYQKELIVIKDSLFTEDLNNKLAILDLNYENVKKEKKILSLKVLNQRQSYQLNRNRLLFIIGLIVVLLLGLGLIVLTQRNKLRNTRKIAELQNKMFRSQMRPHFIFNVLSSIQTYMSNNDGKKAAVFLSKFARLMRNVLEQSKIDFNSMSHEINILSYYLELQQLRFEDGFDFNFDIDDRIDPDIYLIPPLILQPILENAIEHGFQDTSKRGNIDIVFRLNASDLFIEITDNGIGIDSIQQKEASSNSLVKTESLSMKIISEQLEFYDRRLKNEYFMKHEDLSQFGKTGTKVTIKMPYKIQKAG